MAKKYRKLPPTSVLKKQQIGVADAWCDEIFGSVDLAGAPSKDYRSFYPTKEIQSYGDCLTFSFTNIIEMICKMRGITDDDGKELNLSDIHLAVGSGTSDKGNNFNNVGEYARKNGVVLERFAPYTRVWGERKKVFDAIPTFAKRYAKGTGHAWVKNDRASLKNGLLQGPLWIALGLGETYQTHAGTEADPIPPPSKVTVYHAVVDGRIGADDKVYTFDSYARSEVVYSADYLVLYAKLLDPQGLPEGWRTQNVDGQRLLARLLNKLVLRAENPPAKGQLYFVHPDGKRLQYFPAVSSVPLFDQYLQWAKTQNLLVGVDEKNFALLTKTIQENGGAIN